MAADIAPYTKKSADSLELTSTPPSVQDAVCLSSTPCGDESSQESLRAENKVLGLLLHSMMQQYPSGDAWYLAEARAKKRAESMGIPSSAYEGAMVKIRALSAHANQHNPWPKDFFS